MNDLRNDPEEELYFKGSGANLAQVVPVIDRGVRELCYRPYRGHKHGCPNYGIKSKCPPSAPLLSEVIDLSLPIFVLWNRFRFGEHVERMRAKHPDWSERRLACCLYWQGTARRQFKDFIYNQNVLNYAAAYPIIIKCPEACGVNVTATMKLVGIELEWPPKVYAYQVAIMGSMVAENTHVPMALKGVLI